MLHTAQEQKDQILAEQPHPPTNIHVLSWVNSCSCLTSTKQTCTRAKCEPIRMQTNSHANQNGHHHPNHMQIEQL